MPQEAKAPAKWFDCKTNGESPPDIQPGFFSVKNPPSHGASYLGLVVRDNETYEGVSQRLTAPLEQGQCYDFSIDVCRSPLYISRSPTTQKQVNFITPVKLRIWGGNGFSDRRELLAETSPVSNTTWETKNLRLKPSKGTFSFIILEAYFKTPIVNLYNGHILLDNASDIRPATCGEPPLPKLIIAQKPGNTPAKTTAKGPANLKPEPVKPLPTAPETPSNNTSNNKIDRKTLKKGSIIQLDYVYFDVNKYNIKPETEPALKWLADFLRLNPDIVIEVGGHTNNNPSDEYAKELSTYRARSVAEWLIRHGSPASQVQYKGYGKSMPLVPNTDSEGRRKNQRVEITILNIGN
jgi:outer membrane protein OmpA-like peptidoglycan-associated protein